MRWAFAAFMALHGLIHFMGPVKAFGLAQLPQLTQPISRPLGVAWLLAGALVVGAMPAMFLWPRGWWAIGLAAVVLSQIVIVFAWTDAKFGTVANVLLLAVVVHGFLTQGPTSFRAAYEEEAATGLAHAAAAPVVTEADLAPLPEPVQRYLRATGVVGQPRARSYRLRFTGRIRGAADAKWMPFEADQQSFVDPPARLFWMRATMSGLPVEAFHRLVDGHATMRVKLLGAITMVDASGPEMDQSESVTLLNDMCILAPGALLEPTIAWEPIDARAAKARFSHGGRTVEATLFFDEAGLLTDFVSDDRSRASADGKSFTQTRFSTPVRDYRPFGPFKIATHGEARWHLPDGELVYGEFELLELEYGPK